MRINAILALLFFVFITGCEEEQLSLRGLNSDVIYLTFDDGPDAVHTELILDVLKQKNVQATFFCLGKRIETHPEIIYRMVNEGHIVANHTYDHSVLTGLSNAALLENINKTENLIVQYTRQSPKLLRPPKGLISKEQKEFLIAQGYTVIMWDINPRDYDEDNDYLDLFYNILKEVKAGENIILLHDSDHKLEESRMATVYALPVIIDDLTNKGYTFDVINSKAFQVPSPSSFLFH